MENASKALLIAVGILLGIMTLSLLVYVLSATDRMQQAQDEKKVQEELAAFNNTFEAYHKSRMYGTDVISLVNKAIENNNKMDVKKSGEKYYINVKITVKQDFENTIYVVDNNEQNAEQKQVTNSTEIDSIFGQGTSQNVKSNMKLETGKSSTTYELGKLQKQDFVSNNNFKLFFNNFSNDKVKVEGNKTYYLYSALTNFKRAIFTATNVEYDNNGRIYEITVEQIKI